MRPGKQDTKQKIRRRYPDDFKHSEKLLAASHQLHGLLCKKEVRHDQKSAKCVVVVGLWTKICKQYRSILVLCELGLVEDAHVIARSLFESQLYTFFVAKRNIRLRRGWENAPKRPKRRFSMEFRAKIYLARCELSDQKRVNVWNNKRGLKRLARNVSPKVAQNVKKAEKILGARYGEDWMKWLCSGKKSSGAFTVETMSRNLGLIRLYDVTYRMLSKTVHAADALDHLWPTGVPMELNARIDGDIESATIPLRLANALCWCAADVINARFRIGLDKTLNDLAARDPAILDKP